MTDSLETMMKEMMQTREKCMTGARNLFGVLPGMLGDNFDVSFAGNTVIQVMINGTPFGLSVAYPIDANMHYAKYGLVIETALLNANGEIVYDSDLDYEDVRRWSNIEGLVGEFNRLRDLLLGGAI